MFKSFGNYNNPGNFIIDLLGTLHEEINDVFFKESNDVYYYRQHLKTLAMNAWLSSCEIDKYSIINKLTLFQIMNLQECQCCNER